MNRKLVFYLLLVLVVTLAGCTFFSGPAGKRMGEDAAPPVVPPAAAPPSAPQTEQALQAKPFDLARAGWAEYRLIVYNDGRPLTSTVRLEYGSGSANGIKTRSIKRTITSGDAPSVSVDGNGVLYSLRVYNAQNSMTSSAMAPFDQLKADDPVLCADDIVGSPSGAGSITVPGGTFDCKIYSGSFKGSGSTYWAAPGVPVPIKVDTACDGATMELVDWG